MPKNPGHEPAHAIWANEEWMRRIINNALDAVVMMDGEGGVTFWNPSAEKLFGWTKEEALGALMSDLIMPEKYQEAHTAGFKRFLETGVSKIARQKVEVTARKKDGTEFPVELTILPLAVAESYIFSAFIQDLSPLKAVERSLREANTRLEAEVENRTRQLTENQEQLLHAKKMNALVSLTAGIAHELRNPINFISNFAKMNAELLDELLSILSGVSPRIQLDVDAELNPVVDEIKINISRILSHSKRAEKIIQDMMQHARGRSVEHQELDLNVVVQDALNNTIGSQKNQHMLPEIITHYAPDLPAIRGNPIELGQVFINLVENALYAMRQRAGTIEGPYKPYLQIATSLSDEMVEVKITDNGGGIKKEVREHIFEPFFTTKPPGEGTGLGLSLSFDIVTKGHDGSLQFLDLTSDGTTVIVRLPVDN